MDACAYTVTYHEQRARLKLQRPLEHSHRPGAHADDHGARSSAANLAITA